MSAGDAGTFIRRGLAGLRRRLRGPRGGAMNFSTRHDLESRWRLIAPRLPPAPRWFLDVGTNNGDTPRRLAALGHFALGIEVARESAPASMPDNAAVMIAQVTSGSLARAPSFDGVFMLSVFHRIWAIQGPDEARAVLRAAIGRAPLLFFEGSSRHDRWCDLGRPPPPFADMQESASVDWHADLLANGHGDVSVDFLGLTHSLKTREPRPLFAVSRQPA
jgi:hypothetical protein